MTPYQQLVANTFACEWAESPLLFFSGNVFSPLIYYSHLVPTIAGLLLAIIVWRQKGQYLINKLFIALSLLFASWTMLDLLLWADINPAHIMFAWTSLVYLDPLIYLTAFYLLYVFVKKKDMPFSFKLFGALALLPIIVLGPTAHTLVAFDYTNCDREAIEGLVWQYAYALETLVLLACVILSGIALRKAQSREERTQVALLSFGIILFLLAFSFGNIVGSFTENWTVAQYGLFGMPVFLGIILYLMSRFNTFRIKVVATSVLVWSLWFLLFSILFLQTMEVARPIIIATLAIFSLIGTLLVRTVRKEVEQRERIELLARDLEQSNKQQVALIHFITHQLKGFVAKSRNIFAMIQEGDYGVVPETMKPFIDEGFRSSTKGAQTIQEILNAANIKSGKVAYDMKPFDLSALLAAIVGNLKPNADSKGVALTLSVPTDAVMFTGDQMQLENAFKNLIDNTIKYTQQGTITLTLEEDAQRLRFTTHDTGVGITPGDMQHLFTEGGHGAESSKVNVDSTGFGLYIVKNIVEGHKGTVRAESEGTGKGSTFTVELPKSA